MGFVCAHTDRKFQHINKTGIVTCPYCKKKMNFITRKIWGGSIHNFFHALVEIVCSNPDCPFSDSESWEEADLHLKVNSR